MEKVSKPRQPVPLCPGCGAEMVLMPAVEYGLVFGHFYSCRRCGWDAPLKQTEKEAYQVAARRHRELQKPLTLEQLAGNEHRSTAMWCEHNDLARSLHPIIYHMILGKNLLYVSSGGHMLQQETQFYGKLYRYWANKPTEEERKAAAWET